MESLEVVVIDLVALGIVYAEVVTLGHERKVQDLTKLKMLFQVYDMYCIQRVIRETTLPYRSVRLQSPADLTIRVRLLY